MSKLLINEPPLQVLPSLARLIGLNEAMLLQQIHYLTSYSERVTPDGRKWVRCTVKEWQKRHFGFWSIRTINRIIKSLEVSGVVLSTSRMNADRLDQSKWYTVDTAKLDRLVRKGNGPGPDGSDPAPDPPATPKPPVSPAPGKRSQGRRQAAAPAAGRRTVSQSVTHRDKVQAQKQDTTPVAPAPQPVPQSDTHKDQGKAQAQGMTPVTTASQPASQPASQSVADTDGMHADDDSQSVIDSIQAVFNGTPLQDTMPDRVIRQAINSYDPQAHTDHQPESPAAGIKRICQWMALIASNAKYSVIESPAGFLLTRAYKGMDEPAICRRSKLVAQNRKVLAAREVYGNLISQLQKSYPGVDVEGELEDIDGLPPPPELPSKKQLETVRQRLADAQSKADQAAGTALMKIKAMFSGPFQDNPAVGTA